MVSPIPKNGCCRETVHPNPTLHIIILTAIVLLITWQQLNLQSSLVPSSNFGETSNPTFTGQTQSPNSIRSSLPPHTSSAIVGGGLRTTVFPNFDFGQCARTWDLGFGSANTAPQALPIHCSNRARLFSPPTCLNISEQSDQDFTVSSTTNAPNPGVCHCSFPALTSAGSSALPMSGPNPPFSQTSEQCQQEQTQQSSNDKGPSARLHQDIAGHDPPDPRAKQRQKGHGAAACRVAQALSFARATLPVAPSPANLRCEIDTGVTVEEIERLRNAKGEVTQTVAADFARTASLAKFRSTQMRETRDSKRRRVQRNGSNSASEASHVCTTSDGCRAPRTEAPLVIPPEPDPMVICTTVNNSMRARGEASWSTAQQLLSACPAAALIADKQRMRQFEDPSEPDAMLGALSAEFRVLPCTKAFLELVACAVRTIAQLKADLTAAIHHDTAVGSVPGQLACGAGANALRTKI
eukprot:3692071-Rhodomonas_salina.1